MGVNDYIREAKRQLNASKNYKVFFTNYKLQSAKGPTATNNNLVNRTIDGLKKD